MPEILYFIEAMRPSVSTGDVAWLRLGERFGQMAVPGAMAPRKKAGVLVWRNQETEMQARHVLRVGEMNWGVWSLAGEAPILAGVWRDWVPGPRDLERDGALPGIGVVLEDGREWMVPRLMLRTGKSALPTVMGSVDGVVVEKPAARYERLQRLALECLELAGKLSGGMEVDAGRVVEIAIEGLGVNYRLAGADVLLLELMSGRAAADVLMGMVDVDIREGRKKKGLGGS